MKKLFLILILMPVFARERTLFDNRIFQPGGFGGPQIKFTAIDGQFGVLMGGKGAFVINHEVALGGGGFGLVNNISAKASAPEGFPDVSFGYGGFTIDYIVRYENLIHLVVGTLIGGGSMNFYGKSEDSDEDSTYDNPDKFFAIVPEVSAELNITRFLRIDFSAGYRLVGGVEYSGYKNSDLSGIEGGIFLKFGGNM